MAMAFAVEGVFSLRSTTNKASSLALQRNISAALTLKSDMRGASLKINHQLLQLVVDVKRSSRFAAAAAAAAGKETGSFVQKVTARELNEIVMNHRSLPIVVDFYATWCGPCILMAQELESLAIEYAGDVRFLKVDTDEEQALANQLEIRGLPTLVFINQDAEKPAIRTEGLLPKDEIRNIIDKDLKQTS
ncbi:hypothetical protein O6H91_10G071600 [Diphasiastrum complanatum]|uniref:Uncharacterized protein n=1 Tax=Diphasiastrum complanatum TaxID=34168 RepID=A0ACC2CIC0_DIPCM|nr:hypothetical protein O6H91_10G071600 [Diphasiastrum complanatum]